MIENYIFGHFHLWKLILIYGRKEKEKFNEITECISMVYVGNL